jgi:hypothetical protein
MHRKPHGRRSSTCLQMMNFCDASTSVWRARGGRMSPVSMSAWLVRMCIALFHAVYPGMPLDDVSPVQS